MNLHSVFCFTFTIFSLKSLSFDCLLKGPNIISLRFLFHSLSHSALAGNFILHRSRNCSHGNGGRSGLSLSLTHHHDTIVNFVFLKHVLSYCLSCFSLSLIISLRHTRKGAIEKVCFLCHGNVFRKDPLSLPLSLFGARTPDTRTRGLVVSERMHLIFTPFK